MQPGPRGGDPAIGDAPPRDPAGETTRLPVPSRPAPAIRPLPDTVADPMTRRNRPPSPDRPKPDRPPPRPRTPMAVLRPAAAGIDVHSDMHMVCVPAGGGPGSDADREGLPANVRRFGANTCDLVAVADWLAE